MKELILSFETIKEFSDNGMTIGELKKIISEYSKLNNINYTQELANKNITKCLALK